MSLLLPALESQNVLLAWLLTVGPLVTMNTADMFNIEAVAHLARHLSRVVQLLSCKQFP